MTGGIVPRAAISEVSRRGIEHRGKESDEHPLVVTLAKTSIDRAQNLCQIDLRGGDRAQHGLGTRHEKSRTHAFTRNVSDYEPQLSAENEMVVEVSSHLPRRNERRGELVDGRRTALCPSRWQHVHLDLAGDLKLALQSLLRPGRHLPGRGCIP